VRPPHTFFPVEGDRPPTVIVFPVIEDTVPDDQHPRDDHEGKQSCTERCPGEMSTSKLFSSILIISFFWVVVEGHLPIVTGSLIPETKKRISFLHRQGVQLAESMDFLYFIAARESVKRDERCVRRHISFLIFSLKITVEKIQRIRSMVLSVRNDTISPPYDRPGNPDCLPVLFFTQRRFKTRVPCLGCIYGQH